MIGLDDKTAKQESNAVTRNELPTDAGRKILLNNYTTQYIDLLVNGNYKNAGPSPAAALVRHRAQVESHRPDCPAAHQDDSANLGQGRPTMRSDVEDLGSSRDSRCSRGRA